MTSTPPAVAPLGDRALVVTVGDRIGDEVFASVQAVLHRLQGAHPAICDLVAGFASVTVHYEPALVRGTIGEAPHAALARIVEQRLAGLAARRSSDARTIEIPTCYEGELAPDLELVATHAGLPAADVVAIHSGGEYVVQMIGFIPGFPYLAGLDARLTTPRRAEPRTRVAAGSVGIGGEQTGIYPFATPGGWNIIGATPLSLFEPQREPAALLRVGDRVRFVAISRDRYDAMAGR